MRMGRWAGVFVRVTIDPEILVALLGLQLRVPAYVRSELPPGLLTRDRPACLGLVLSLMRVSRKAAAESWILHP